MRTKWLLLALPLAILVLLFQSALWVPTLSSQARGNPERLVTFIRGSIGDAKFPNPILITDKGTSDVFEKNVFEMLLTSDEHMSLVPMLASSWETTEEAFVLPRPERKLPNGASATARALADAIEAARQGGSLGDVGKSIQSVRVVPAQALKTTTAILVQNAKGKDEPLDVALTLLLPERVELTLSRVETELFVRLEAVLGTGYAEGYPLASLVALEKPEQLDKLRPKLAELVSVLEHNPVLTFHLRQDVLWHDGEPFTAADVKFTYEALIDGKNASPRAGSYDTIKALETPDPFTVRVKYKRLYAQSILDWASMGMIPRHLLDDAALAREADRRHLSASERKKQTLRTSDFNRHPIGTGPFRFVEWQPDQYIRLERNERYWRTKPQYKQLYFRVLPDFLSMEVEFGAGALDLYEALSHQAERYRHDPNYQVVDNRTGWYTYIAYNMRRWPFQDARVRRALGMAIDVKSVIKYALSGEGNPSNGPFFSNTPFSDPSVKPLAYDPKAAQALLEEAGFRKNAAGIFEKDGKPLAFTLVTNAGNVPRKAVMTVAQEAWRKLGVDCKVQAVEWTVFLEEFALKGNFDALIFGWVGGDMSPDKFEIWHSSQTDPYKLNFVGYKSAEADALMEAIRRSYDPQEQIRLTHLLHRRIFEDQPYTFVYEPHQPYVLDKRIFMLGSDASGKEAPRRITTPPNGDALYAFNQWRKWPSMPELAP